ncbi:hypothetical protein IJ670_04975 [bacterium]|nr:hypothetical protein [bacterium]
MYDSSSLDEIAKIRNLYCSKRMLCGNIILLTLFLGIGLVVYSFTSEIQPLIYVGYTFLLMSLPFLYCYTHLNKYEEEAILKFEDEVFKKTEILKKQLQREDMKRFTDVQTYAICVSLDYEATRELTSENKIVLNKIVYTQMKVVLNNLAPYAEVSCYDDILVIKSNDFKKYDDIYTIALKTLSKIKRITESKYAVNITVSMTTDAYGENIKDDVIKNSHKSIKGSNFINRACSTSKFSDKYKFLKQSKYLGVPIGEYASFDKNQDDTWELNIIYKNLDAALSVI